MADLIALKNKRKIIKGKITRIKNFVNAYKPTDDRFQLESRVAMLESAMREYDDVQTEIELKDEAEMESGDREVVEEQYFNTLSSIKSSLDKTNPTTFGDTNAGSSRSDTSNSDRLVEASIKLPVLDLPKFSGSYSEWMSFYDTFNSLINNNPNLNDCQRFHYLKSALKDDAITIIDSLSISADNYKSAFELLKKRFNNARLIAQEHVLAIINTPSITKSNHTALRKLLTDVTANIEALKVQNLPVNQWDGLIVPLICEKMDYNTRKEWQTRLTSEIPTLNELIAFLEKGCELLESMQYINQKSQANDNKRSQLYQKYPNAQNNNNKGRPIVQTISNKGKCLYCKSDAHMIFKCSDFLNLSTEDRINHLNQIKACFNCLKLNHNASSCKSTYSCKECNSKHHTLIHIPEQSSSNNLTLSVNNPSTKIVLLATAIVKITDVRGNRHDCRIMLDCGSQSHLITEKLCRKLGIETNKINLPIVGVGEIETSVKGSAKVTIHSRFNLNSLKLQCLVLPKITASYPNESYSISNLNLPQNINLADPSFNESSEIELLIGAEHFWNLISAGQIRLDNNQICLRETVFGWIVTGNLNICTRRDKTVVGCAINSYDEGQLNQQLTKFWELEQITSVNKTFSSEEIACEEHFSATFKRDSNGKFIVRLPFKGDSSLLGRSDGIAIKQFRALETKLNKNSKLKDNYTKFMNEYKQLHHMKQISNQQRDRANSQYWLAHHGVIKEASTTTKLRVVFNGSIKTSSGISLNDILMVGPTIQQDLFSIVTRFRTYQIAFTCDIIKMYRQIWIHPDDTRFQRIFWRDDVQNPIEIYELQTVTYGTASAPYLAIKCLQQLSIDEQKQFPLACPIIARDFYVDDLLTGSETVTKAIQLRNELIGALSKGGFHLQKWASNCPELIPSCHETLNESAINFDNKYETKTLGLVWNCKDDIFKYSVRSEESQIPTKRSILSRIAQIYDILGLLSPVVVTIKILIQKLWILKLDWDEPLTDELRKTWQKISSQLNLLNTLSIPRKIVSNSFVHAELHGFCDASMAAYGACVYIRTISKDGFYKSELLCARSRVAPIKTVSLPRLELSAAVLLAHLVHKITLTLNLTIDSTYLWSDSSIVLFWLNSPPNKWKTFVSNRVADIQSLTNVKNWHHINSENNPADIVSRGLLPDTLINNNLWFHGPSFLLKSQTEWPTSKINETIDKTMLEERGQQTNLVISEKNTYSILRKFSSLLKLQRVLAYCFRFIHNCVKTNEKHSGILTTVELDKATKIIVKLTQLEAFKTEINDLRNGKPVNQNSKLLKLNPFLDKDEILRVGGRLRNAKLDYNHKFQILLPAKHHITKLIILSKHKNQLHAGPSATLAAVREEYWPLAARSVVRQLLHNCYTCFRVNPRLENQFMGDLPPARVKPSRPFLHCGADYGGPIIIKEGTRRSKKTIKVYFVLFKCFATKAVHLELIHDCTAESFLYALKRFMARRGKVASIYSDNATYFTAANRELNRLFKTSEFEQNVVQNLTHENIKWYFIPAKSPHRGGYWEAGIKAVKYHLKRLAGNALLTHEELYTLLVQIEACVNSRPLTPLSYDPHDMTPLTPGHFLIGDHLTTNVEPNLTVIKENTLSRWQRVQCLTQHFWKRWSKEYLNTLQQRSKWCQRAKSTIKPGLPVLLKEDNLHPLCWRMGVVSDVLPGKDGIIRTVSVKTSTGQVIRSINRLCPFPDPCDIECEDSRRAGNVQYGPAPKSGSETPSTNP